MRTRVLDENQTEVEVVDGISTGTRQSYYGTGPSRAILYSYTISIPVGSKTNWRVLPKYSNSLLSDRKRLKRRVTPPLSAEID